MLLMMYFLLGILIGSILTASLIWYYQVECDMVDDEMEDDNV